MDPFSYLSFLTSIVLGLGITRVLAGCGKIVKRAISGINSYWLRGYGNPPPETLAVVGIETTYLSTKFESCTLAGRVTNKYNVRNEETRNHPNIYVCRGLKRSWEEFWKQFRYFG